jgi:rfaE bifunctional protein nucleotidyltransferase chain/domain
MADRSRARHTRAQDKIVDVPRLGQLVKELKHQGSVVALCHGCFDILHVGHVRHLEAARDLADVLVVTVTADQHVNKGPNRPVFPEGQRAEVLAGLRAVDWVAISPAASATDVIETVQPDLFVKGQEYELRPEDVNPNFLAEARAVETVGGRVAFTYELTSSSSSAFERLQADTS